MEALGSILPKAFKGQILGGKTLVLEILAPSWARVAGKFIAQHSRPVAFSAGTLTLATSSLSWAVQLRQMSEPIRVQINAFMCGAVVRRLRVRYQPEPAGIEAAPSSLPRQHHPEAAAPALEAKKLLGFEAAPGLDPEVAGIVERSFVKYFSRNRKKMN